MEGLGKALKEHMETARPPKVRTGNLSLDSRTRLEVYRFMVHSPCSTIPTIARALDKGETTIRWHIRKMEKADVVGSVRNTGRINYFPKRIFTREVLDIMNVFSEGGRDVVDLIERTPGMSRSDLLDGTEMGKNRLDRKLLDLLDIGVIRKVRDGSTTRYFPAERLTEVLASLDSEMKGSRDRLAQVLHNEVPGIFSLSTKGPRLILEGQFGVITFRFPF